MASMDLFDRVVDRIAEDQGADREDIMSDLANTLEITLLERMSRTEYVVETAWTIFKEEYGLSDILRGRDCVLARGFDDGTARVVVIVATRSVVHNGIWPTAAAAAEWQAMLEILWRDAIGWKVTGLLV